MIGRYRTYSSVEFSLYMCASMVERIRISHRKSYVQYTRSVCDQLMINFRKLYEPDTFICVVYVSISLAGHLLGHPKTGYVDSIEYGLN